MFRAGIALFAVVAVLPTIAQAQPKNSGDVVKITATSKNIDTKGEELVTIEITIEKPYHIYANPVGQEDLASAQTVVTITGKNKLDDVKIDYPKGKVHPDKTIGDFNVYEEKVTITAKVQRGKGDSGPLKATIKLQACTDKNCLMPAKIDVDVK
jgi:DsbC/DsbD-like thiol-disulfide interchange protein